MNGPQRTAVCCKELVIPVIPEIVRPKEPKWAQTQKTVLRSKNTDNEKDMFLPDKTQISPDRFSNLHLPFHGGSADISDS